MTLLDQLGPLPAAPGTPEPRPLQVDEEAGRDGADRSGRGAYMKRRQTKQDRIAAARQLDDELRQTRQEQEARWCAEELARQAQTNPPGVEPVGHQE